MTKMYETGPFLLVVNTYMLVEKGSALKPCYTPSNGLENASHTRLSAHPG
jgi:hypothetical protein